ncbi:cell wall hydrolase [Roseateles chitinivorans]|uniref:cell wall hydrolase n=1 Tax=Roseateles chitinivorans TaxID=2917965 RepID=UPI003D679274
MGRVRRVMATGCALPLLLSCSALQPVPDPPALQLFHRGKLPGKAASAESDGATNPAQVPPTACPDSAKDWQTNPNCFYGGLGVIIDGVDAYADALTNSARSNINATARFNAAVPFLGAILLYKRIHDGTSLLGPSAVAAGTYAALNGGIPDIHNHYTRAAHDLQCATLRQSLWLYRNDEIVGQPALLAMTRETRLADPEQGSVLSDRFSLTISAVDKDGRAVSDRASLDVLIRRLQGALDRYDEIGQETYDLLRPPPAGEAGGAFERARGGGGGGGKKDSRARIKDFMQARVDLAQAMLEKLETLRRQVEDAGFVLYQEAKGIDRDIVRVLGLAQPRFRDPQAAAKEIKDRVPALAQASGEEAPTSRMAPSMPPELTDGVKSAAGLQVFNKTQGAELYNAWLAARRFVQRHNAREQRVKGDLLRFGCGDSLVSSPCAAREFRRPVIRARRQHGHQRHIVPIALPQFMSARNLTLADRPFAMASAALAGRKPVAAPDWLDRSALSSVAMSLPGAGEPALLVGLREGWHAGAFPRRWRLPGTAELLPVQCRPAPAACAQRLPELVSELRPTSSGSATALLRDRLSSRRYLLTCGHVAAPSPISKVGDLVRIEDLPEAAGLSASLRVWQPMLADGALRTTIDAALLELDEPLFAALAAQDELLPAGVDLDSVCYQDALTLRSRRSVPVAGRALVQWSGEVDIPGLTPGVADYFLERAIGYRADATTQGGDSGAALWNARDELCGMHLAGLPGAGFGANDPNALFGAIAPVLSWFSVNPVLKGGRTFVPPATSATIGTATTRSGQPASSAVDLSDREVVAATLWGEARNQGVDGLKAVACVIANRARTRYRRCENERAVCLDPKQFSCWNDRDPNRPRMLAVARQPDDSFRACLALADDLLARPVRLTDITDNARHYHTSSVHPDWSAGKKPCAAIGDHLFYNDVA